MRELSLGILGLGNVGSAFLSLIYKKRKEVERKYGVSLKLIFACNSRGGVYQEEGIDLKEFLKKTLEESPEKYKGWELGISGEELIKRGVDVIVEATPTSFDEESPGMKHFLTALNMGSHVITSNKGPLALKFWDLMNLAERRGSYILFEGTVMSGTPVISLLRSLRLGTISRIRGILNGTTNYILTKMEEGKDFSEALSEAISKGFAEKDPRGDLRGYDAAAKIVILANYGLGIRRSIKDVEIRGIEGISKKEVLRALSEGKRIKLIAEATSEEVRVSPAPVQKGDPLFEVDGIKNCVIFEHEELGRVIITGPGAGGKETAFAMLSDLSYLLSKITPR